jgi:hypothetical protein
MSWPSYPVGPTDHVHALGVVSINYNTLELNLFVATIFYLDGKAAPAAIIFDTTRNNKRIDLLRALWAHEPLAEVRERLNHFADGFLKCAQNRNILMHSYLTSRVHEFDILRLANRSKQQSSVSTYEHQHGEQDQGPVDPLPPVPRRLAEIPDRLHVRRAGRGFPAPRGGLPRFHRGVLR